MLYSETIWGVDLADMQPINNLVKDLDFYYVIDIFSKYAWVVPLKDKKVVTIVNAFQKTLDKSACQPNKIWVDKGSEFSNSFSKNG